MATQIKHRRGNTAEIMAATPAVGELWFNTDDNTNHMGDGVTLGGVKQAKLASVMLESATLAHARARKDIKLGFAIDIKEKTSTKGGGVVADVELASAFPANGESIFTFDEASLAAYTLVFRHLESPYGVKDNSEMIATDLTLGQTVVTQGSATQDDGERSTYLIVAGGTDPVNNITLDNGHEAQEMLLGSAHIDHDGELLSTVLSKQISIERSKALMGINVRKPLNSWGMRAPINILGDSISHGAFAGELYYNGYTRILSRMFAGDFGGLSYQGFVPMLTLDSGGPNESKDIHTIAFQGTWVGQDSVSTANGAASYNGVSFQSVIQNDLIRTTIPSFQNKVRLWYLQQPGGGVIRTAVNFVTTGADIDTDGPLSVQSRLIATIDDGQGSCVIQASKFDATAKPVDICGYGYFDDVETPVVHNFSTSGRRLHYVADQTITDLAANASIFMLALGHNDQGDVDADPAGAYALQFTAKINQIIAQCNANDTLLVVNDFCWAAADTSFARLELKRAATETNGVYIPFPNLIKPDGTITDATYLTTTINMWADGSHPNEYGNKWIAETIAKYLGLSITSKKTAIAYNDYWMPFAIPAGTENSFTGPGSVSAYRINGEEINFRCAVQKGAGGSFAVGTHNLQTAWRVTPPFIAVGTSLTLPGVVRGDTNILTSSLNLGQTGAVDLVVTDGTWINNQQCLGKLPIVLD